MIRVIVKFTRKLYKSGRELFIYKDISVTGHSSDGTINSLKCCAGVTAITCGLMNIFDDITSDVTINKGYFHYRMKKFDNEINYAINALVYQLDGISITYPSYIDIQFIEEKTNGEEN